MVDAFVGEEGYDVDSIVTDDENVVGVVALVDTRLIGCISVSTPNRKAKCVTHTKGERKEKRDLKKRVNIPSFSFFSFFFSLLLSISSSLSLSLSLSLFLFISLVSFSLFSLFSLSLSLSLSSKWCD